MKRFAILIGLILLTLLGLVVKAQECDTITSFPWIEGFEWESSDNTCWILNGFSINNPSISIGDIDEDDHAWSSNHLLTASGSGSYLITPAISLPADATTLAFVIKYANAGNKPLEVLVSTTAATDTALFTDTLALLPSGNPLKTRKLSLAEYAGQTIRIAVIHRAVSALRILEAGVDYNTLPKIASVTVPAKIPTGSATLCSTALRYGSTNGLQYTWSSAMGGTFTANALGDSAWVTYPTGDMTDTLTVVATNIYGSDTLSKTLYVVDCTPATTLPWSDNFDNGLICWQQAEGSNWITRSSNTLNVLHNKGNVLCSNISMDSVYDLIFSKPITLVGTTDDSIKLYWNTATSNGTFPHSYGLLITTDDPSSSSCTCDTLYRADSLVFGNNSWTEHSVSLAAYAGQTVHLAFYNHPLQLASASNQLIDLYIDDILIRPTAIPVITLEGPAEVNSEEMVTYTVTLTEGATNGLSYTWHSSLMDTAYIDNSINAQFSNFNLVYTTGGTDTITVIASNTQGADTAAIVVSVNDCSPLMLPWLEDFSTVTPVAYNAANGSLPPCWHHLWNGNNANYAPHIISSYPFNPISSYLQSNTALLMIAGTDEGFDSVAIVESPRFADPLKGQILSFFYMHESYDSGTLSVGYMQGNSFVSFSDMEQQQTGRSVSIRLDAFPPNIHQFALKWKKSGVWYGVIIDSIQVLASDSLPTVHIDAPAVTRAFDNTLLRAYLTNGDTTGLTYSWHSAMATTGQASLTAVGDIAYILYSTIGTDTISVIATNAAGSDTAWHTLEVVGSPAGTIHGPGNVFTDDTNIYAASMIYGIDSAVSFSWHSSMAVSGNATMLASDDTMRIVYLVGGIDTLTLTTSNVVGSSTTTRTVTVTECHISSFPWSEGFENGLSNCWRIWSNNHDEWMHNWSVHNYSYHAHSGSRYMFSQNLSGEIDTTQDWLMMPPIDVPSASHLNLNFYAWYMGEILTNTNPGLTIVASTQGRDNRAFFTDTLFSEQNNTGSNGTADYVLRSVSLISYEGQTVWIAFVHANKAMNLALDDISIDHSAIPVVDISGPTQLLSCDEGHFSATLLHGDATGITYTWHSNMADAGLATITTTDSTATIDYHAGGNDVITVTATNAAGSDTASIHCNITDCESVTQFPWSVSLTDYNNNKLTCWLWNGGWFINNYLGSGITCMTCEGLYIDTVDAWLITREIGVPNDMTQSYTLQWHMLCDHSVFQVLVSTQGRNDLSFFIDTLYAVMSDTSSWRTYTASLDAYRGQNIYIAFHNNGWYNSPENYSDGGVVRIDSVQILANNASVGIDNDWASALNFQLSIYPNPAQNDVTISISEPSFITVFDMTGKIVIPQTAIESEQIIPLSTFASGLYLIRCQTAYGIITKKLIIK